MSDSAKPIAKATADVSTIVWLDLEMTGLDPEQHCILETAMILTDNELNITHRGPQRVIHQPLTTLTAMDSWNRKHHRKSGLWDEALASTTTLRAAEELNVAFLREHCPSENLVLAGNSIWQDRRFIIAHMPELNKLLHYRMIDVSSIKQLVAMWYPDHRYEAQKSHSHRAMADIEESIDELRFYREKILIS